MALFVCLLFLILNIFIDGDLSDKNNARQVIPINYNLSSPDKIFILPKVLNEISGISGADASSIACIQDENGFLFIYDMIKEQINKQLSFYHNGDYEGIALADKTAYILRSDGMLFEVTNFDSGNGKTVSYSTGIPANDNEGLCYDRSANRLLIAPKSKVDNKSGNKDQRFIYAFDLKSKKLIVNPVFVFDVSIIKKFAKENNIKLPKGGDKKGDKNESTVEFRPSAIGIHPITNRLYLISGMEKMLFVFDMKGNIEFMEKLDSDLFLQPEGITFLKNGDMLISNEGQNKKPTILRFNYSEKKTSLY
jgi:hypothetical protein